MDDSLLAEFQSTFLIGGEVHDTHVQHPHYTLYKHKRDGFADQGARRKKMLEEQKSRRRDYANYVRKIVDGEELDDDEMDEGPGYDEVDTKGDNEGMQVTKKTSKRKQKYPYSNQLMLSEWLVDVPEDLETNWYMIVCPVGKRCLVVAARGTTCSYARAGNLINNFPSLLPGGCQKTYRIVRDYSLLDCIYHEGSRRFYVLDILCWRGHPVYDSDTEFRQYWLATKFREDAYATSEYSRINPLTFHDLTYHSCTKDNVAKILSEKQPYEVDGLLFIDKRSHYTIGPSPLAVWLKPKMVPDILGWPVSEDFLSSSSVQMETEMETSKNGGGGGKVRSRRRRRHKQQGQGGETEMDATVSESVVDEVSPCGVSSSQSCTTHDANTQQLLDTNGQQLQHTNCEHVQDTNGLQPPHDMDDSEAKDTS